MVKKLTKRMQNKQATIRKMSDEERIEAIAEQEEAKLYGKEWEW